MKLVSQRCNKMFFDCVWGGYSEHLPFTPDNVVDEVIAHTEYTRGKFLGHTQHEGRPFYLFWKD